MAYAAFDLDDLKVKMEERWDSTPFWNDTEAQNALNEALLVWNSLTGFWKRRVTIATVSNQHEYTLPASMVFGMRVEYNSAPLIQSSLSEMDNGYPGWQGESGTPKRWIPVDLNHIMIHPAPALNAQTFTIDGIAATPQLLNDADSVDLGSDMLWAIIDYALHAVALKEGGMRFAATQAYFESFLAAAAIENAQLMKSEMFRQFLGTDMKRQEQPTK